MYQGEGETGSSSTAPPTTNEAVCSGSEPLSQAQQDIATDWIAAYCKARLQKCPDGVHLSQDPAPK